jgi:hypothetical protein
VIDRSQDAEGSRAYKELRLPGELTVRRYVTWVVSLQGAPQKVRERIEAIPLATGWEDDWVRVGSLKAFLDGGILISFVWGEDKGLHRARKARRFCGDLERLPLVPGGRNQGH